MTVMRRLTFLWPKEHWTRKSAPLWKSADAIASPLPHQNRSIFKESISIFLSGEIFDTMPSEREHPAGSDLINVMSQVVRDAKWILKKITASLDWLICGTPKLTSVDWFWKHHDNYFSSLHVSLLHLFPWAGLPARLPGQRLSSSFHMPHPPALTPGRG